MFILCINHRPATFKYLTIKMFTDSCNNPTVSAKGYARNDFLNDTPIGAPLLLLRFDFLKRTPLVQIIK